MRRHRCDPAVDGAGGPRRLIGVALAGLLACIPIVVGAQNGSGYSLGALREMAAAGAPGLALQRMDRVQPAVSEAPAVWVRWERARLQILIDAGARRRAIARIRALPDAAPESFRRQAQVQRAGLHLDLGDARPARELVRTLLWQTGQDAEPAKRRQWRRLVIRSYLVGGRIEDAVTAVQRFEQDFGAGATEWAILRARVYLRAGSPGRIDTATEAGPDELRALHLLAALRSERRGAAEVQKQALQRARAEAVSGADAARYWFVAAEAAALAGEPARRAEAIEQAVAGSGALPATDALFALDGDAIWSAWLGLGTAYGNRQQLLIGDDSAWFEAAQAAAESQPVRARALLAVVAVRGARAGRERAHRRLLDRIEAGPGLLLARRAYLDSGRFATLADVPEIVRYRLVDRALARDDLALATRLMQGLPGAPEGVSAFDWGLLRARVFILGGRQDEGVQALEERLRAHPGLAGDDLDRFLQVVFDLQGAQAHKAALQILRRLGERELAGQRRRELLYWQAESHQALDRPERAALLYMRSATLLDGTGGDPWGQTARYQAARMLAEAGFVGDARRIYQRLLRVTESEDRRATLRQRLRKLGPREAASGDLPSTESIP